MALNNYKSNNINRLDLIIDSGLAEQSKYRESFRVGYQVTFHQIVFYGRSADFRIGKSRVRDQNEIINMIGRRLSRNMSAHDQCRNVGKTGYERAGRRKRDRDRERNGHTKRGPTTKSSGVQ